MHPMATSRVRLTRLGTQVLSYEQRHTSVSTDFRHGFGELISAQLAEPPGANLGYAQTVFTLSQSTPYALGVTDQLMNEVNEGFNTGSMRNIYSPNVVTARELVLDELAATTGQDPYRLRRALIDDERAAAVLDRVAEAGAWGRRLPAGVAQGIAVHSEYKSRVAVLVELDCRPATVGRHVEHGFTGPRVTKAVCAVDVGLPINPRGLEAQLLGGLMDGIAIALTFSVHVRDGHALEGSWDDGFYTRQWNVPFDVQLIVMPPTSNDPGGAGELGVAASSAAVACAHARATGTMPTTFPINHDRADLGFEVFPTVPPIPAPPDDGLAHAF
jgi:isoquinoline 1-oxidoreductase beta subunit